jgi:hypothetical protein
MSLKAKLKKAGNLFEHVFSEPGVAYSVSQQIPENMRGLRYAKHYQDSEVWRHAPAVDVVPDNKLEEFFDRRTHGHGIWKWRHYFEIYDRHFRKFVGRDLRLLEIGIFSGGSLEMWRSYFGDQCYIYGVDIADVCRVYENSKTSVFIGDQEDRSFWKQFKRSVPPVDILIDDGGHTFGQQIVTFEEMLPHIRPGGVYVCEDIHGIDNGFNSYCQGFIKGLNENIFFDPNNHSAVERRVNEVQASIKGMFFYPFITVVEKNEKKTTKLSSERHGTLWQPIRTT